MAMEFYGNGPCPGRPERGVGGQGPDQVPGGPVIGVFHDPDGNTIGLMQP